MILNLKDYTDVDEVAEHAHGYMETWRFMQYLDRQDDVPSLISLGEQAEEHRDWLVENVPWLVPHLDMEIVNFLRPADLI